MPVDIITTPAKPRTYRVPKKVQHMSFTASVNSRDNVDEDIAYSLFKGVVTSDELETISNMSREKIVDHYGQDTYDWVTKTLTGEREAALKSALRASGYNSDMYDYIGVESSGNQDVLTQLLRVPRGEDIQQAEKYTSNGWVSLPQVASGSGALLDEGLVAAMIDTINDGCNGLYVSPAEPICYLESNPMLVDPILAAAPPATSETEETEEPVDDETEDTELDTSDKEHVYAIVDEADTSAVLNVIAIDPGPIVYVRTSGAWKIDTDIKSQLLSMQPPSLVELDEEQQNTVFPQVDSMDSVSGEAEDLEDNEDGTVSPTDESLTEDELDNESMFGSREKKDKNKKSLVAGVMALNEDRVSRAYEAYHRRNDEYHDEYNVDANVPLNTLLASSQAQLELDLAKARIDHLARLDRVSTDLENREKALTLVAAGKKLRSNRNRGNAETLRRYWTKGAGAVKIAWGTSGDWYRCVSKLTKYLGLHHAKGYCNLRHKEATGMYPGDKRNK